MNDENLIPLNKRAKSEQREIQRKGTEASIRARRDKRDLRQVCEVLMQMPLKNKEGQRVISPVTGKPMSIIEGIATSTIQGAVNGKIKNTKLLTDVMGWNAAEKYEVKQTIADERTLEEVNEQIKRLLKLDELTNTDGTDEK